MVQGSRFDKIHNLDANQLKRFDKMYIDRGYSLHDIRERFNLSLQVILDLARARNLTLRKGRPPDATPASRKEDPTS